MLSRAPFIIDLLAYLIVMIIPLQLLSYMLVRWRRTYRFHKWMQIGMGVALGLVLLVFEIEMRLIGWRRYAEDSPLYDSWVLPALLLHLIFAIPTLLLWIATIYGALKNFPSSPKPSKYSIIHKRLGRLAAWLMLATALTGWLFYYLAFVLV